MNKPIVSPDYKVRVQYFNRNTCWTLSLPAYALTDNFNLAVYQCEVEAPTLKEAIYKMKHLVKEIDLLLRLKNIDLPVYDAEPGDLTWQQLQIAIGRIDD